jgi:aryl-alcohol dehydrogenase-like predicted oxidoreductase
MESTMAPLGRSAQLVGRLAFGCEQLGGHAWGAIEPADIIAAIEEAVHAGVTLFDTADCYGHGESERRLGQALAPHRARVLIATKFGVRFNDAGGVWYDSSPQWARAALEESRRRLDTDVVDLLQVHYWDGVTPLTQLFEALERLREEHKIRWYGISNYAPDAALTAAFPGLVSASFEYSLVDRSHEWKARSLAAAGLTFLAYGTLGQGILSGAYGAQARFGDDDRRAHPRYHNFHGARLERNLRLLDVVREQAEQLGAPPSQLAIAWVLKSMPGSVALVGIKRVDQLRDALGALTLGIPQCVKAALDRVSADASLAPLP